jgi:hypothetical protein
MYAWIFRHLPGPLWLRVLQAGVLAGLAIAVLMTWVFPWISEFLPWTASTLGSSTTHTPA